MAVFYDVPFPGVLVGFEQNVPVAECCLGLLEVPEQSVLEPRNLSMEVQVLWQEAKEGQRLNRRDSKIDYTAIVEQEGVEVGQTTVTGRQIDAEVPREVPLAARTEDGLAARWAAAAAAAVAAVAVEPALEDQKVAVDAATEWTVVEGEEIDAGMMGEVTAVAAQVEGIFLAETGGGAAAGAVQEAIAVGIEEIAVVGLAERIVVGIVEGMIAAADEEIVVVRMTEEAAAEFASEVMGAAGEAVETADATADEAIVAEHMHAGSAAECWPVKPAADIGGLETVEEI